MAANPLATTHPFNAEQTSSNTQEHCAADSVGAIHIRHGLIGDGTANIVFSRKSVRRRQSL
jgi:hypothetical protein